MSSQARTVTMVDTSLRDGMSSVSHQFTPAAGRARSHTGLDRAGVDVDRGRARRSESAARRSSTVSPPPPTPSTSAAAVGRREAGGHRRALRARHRDTVATSQRRAARPARRTVRVATHCTEADCAEQPIRWAAGAGACGSSLPDDEPQARARRRWPSRPRKLESYGAARRLRRRLGGRAGARGRRGPGRRAARGDRPREIGFHAHNNLGVGDRQLAGGRRARAPPVSTARCAGLGASAGNAQTEVLAAALERAGYDTGVDAVRADGRRRRRRRSADDRAADHRRHGAHRSATPASTRRFFHPAKRAAKKFGVPGRDILLELGRRGSSAARRT